MDLTFLGKTIDTCNNDAETSSDTWNVKFKGVIRQKFDARKSGRNAVSSHYDEGFPIDT